MKIFHQIAFVLFFMNANAQKTIEIKTYYEVYGDTITESNRGHILHEKFHVLKSDNKIKNGKYIRFSKLMDILEEGNYCKGSKCGIWESYSFDGCLITKYDYDQSRELEPEIDFKKLYKYPFEYQHEAEKGDSLKTGEVVISFEFSENCELLKCDIIKFSYNLFNQIAVDGFRKYVTIMHQINQVIPECKDKKSILRVQF